LLCIVSQRKKPLIVIDDYIYRRNRDNYWRYFLNLIFCFLHGTRNKENYFFQIRCIRCSSKKCRASLILNEDGGYTLCITEHTHLPEEEKLKDKQFIHFHSKLLSPPKSRKMPMKKEHVYQIESVEEHDEEMI
jgi:hypothetical protein